MGDDAQELIDAWPGNSPWKCSFSKFGKNPLGDMMVRTGTDLCTDKDVRIDRLHGLPAVDEIEDISPLRATGTS
jgi:hypothetical protein